jgi:hypothetical protein
MTETTIIYLAILILCLISMFVVRKFKIKFLGLDMFYDKSVDNTNKIHELVHLALDNQKEVMENNNNILKNQLIYAEGILTKIESKLLLELPKDKIYQVQIIVHDILKDYFKENGFSGMNGTEFSNYVANRTEQLRKVYRDSIGETKFIESHDFSSMMLDLFNHSTNCAIYWANKTTESINKYQKEYDRMISEIK